MCRGNELVRLNIKVIRNSASNLGVAFVFFGALYAHAKNYNSFSATVMHAHHYAGLADLVWMLSAALMGILSLIRVPPSASMVNARPVLATVGMMIAPAFIRAESATTGLLALSGLAIEFFGVILGEGSRIYLGRRFGFLPANRGVVTSGPFRVVRHPIYSGGLILTLGLLMVYPAPRNFLMLAITIPVMIYRIILEEQLLALDPEYRAYCEITRCRLIPFIY